MAPLGALGRFFKGLFHALTWPEWIGLVLLLGAVVGLALRGDQLTPLTRAAAWLALLPAFAVLGRRGLPKLFGPVFVYDLTRTIRRSRAFSIRGVYAFLLLFILFLLYVNYPGIRVQTFADLFADQALNRDELPRFAGRFFTTFMIVQFVLVLLLTPASTAAALTEEKERRTFEFLLVTELDDREIVLGKLGSRSAYLGLFVLTGLPILSLVQFFGGVDPNLVLASYLATAVTIFSLGSLALVNSAYHAKSRGAVFWTYVQIVCYYVFTGFCCWPFVALGGSLNPLNWVGAGNAIVGLFRVYGSLANPTDELWPAARDYCVFHAVVGIACCAWASTRLRIWHRQPPPVLPPEPAPLVSLANADFPERARPVLAGRGRPPVGERPMLWKEVHIEPGLGMAGVSRALGPVPVVLGLFALTYLTLGFCAMSAVNPSADSLARLVNGLVRGLGTPVLCLMLVGIALRAAGTMTVERERQTLDSLLTTPLADRDILGAKWLVSLWSVRKGLWVLGALWFLGLLFGGLHPLALPLLLFAAVVYAAVVASLGLFLSLTNRSTLRATLWTLLAAVGLAALPWALWNLVVWAILLAGWEHDMPTLVHFDAYQLMPPMTLWLFSFLAADITQRQVISWQLIATLLGGVTWYGLLAAGLWGLACRRFEAATGRLAADGRAAPSPKRPHGRPTGDAAAASTSDQESWGSCGG